MRRAAKDAQLDITPRTSTNHVLNLLRKQEVISYQVMKLIYQLRTLRNYAAHETDFTIPADEVINYIDVTLRVSNALRQPSLLDGEGKDVKLP